MSNFLLAISIGPVQDFIAAARRMGDLYSGSQILSSISMAVAQSVAQTAGKENLIFPYPKALDNQNASVANVVLAEVKDADADAIKQIVSKAKTAATNAFKQMAMATFAELKNSINADVWATQIEDVVEFFAA